MNPKPLPLRRLDLDLLRVIATYLVVVFHVSQVFSSASVYHIRNADTSFIDHNVNPVRLD